MSKTPGIPSTAPLAKGEGLEQDGSEDPGASMEPLRDPAASPEAARSNDPKRREELANAPTTSTNPVPKKGI